MEEVQMTDEGDPRSAFEKVTEAVQGATEAVQSTTESLSGAIDDSRRPGGVLDQLSRFTREAPLRSLTLAFLAGLIVARRR